MTGPNLRHSADGCGTKWFLGWTRAPSRCQIRAPRRARGLPAIRSASRRGANAVHGRNCSRGRSSADRPLGLRAGDSVYAFQAAVFEERQARRRGVVPSAGAFERSLLEACCRCRRRPRAVAQRRTICEWQPRAGLAHTTNGRRELARVPGAFRPNLPVGGQSQSLGRQSLMGNGSRAECDWRADAGLVVVC